VDLNTQRLNGIQKLDELREATADERGATQEIRAPFIDKLMKRAAGHWAIRDDGLSFVEIGAFPRFADRFIRREALGKQPFEVSATPDFGAEDRREDEGMHNGHRFDSSGTGRLLIGREIALMMRR